MLLKASLLLLSLVQRALSQHIAQVVQFGRRIATRPTTLVAADAHFGLAFKHLALSKL